MCMERLELYDHTEDPLVLAEQIAAEKIAAHEAAVAMHEVLQLDGITSLLQIIISHALPLI